MCSKEPYEYARSYPVRANWLAPQPEADLLISANEVKLDRTWFTELKKSTEGTSC